MKSVYVVFTASITPHAGALVAAGNVNRENEYIEAVSANVRLARSTCINAIYLLAENSGAVAPRLKRACAQLGVQFIQCAPTPKGAFKGKGHSEVLMMNETIERAAGAAKESVFLKVTGRLQVKNLDKLLYTAYSTSSDCLVNLHSRAGYADTRVMIVSPAFWKCLMPMAATIDDANHRYLEHIVPLAIKAAGAAGLKCDYLLPPPLIMGRSASTGKIYKMSRPGHTLEYLKILLKKVIYSQRKL